MEIGDVLGVSTRTVVFHKYERMQSLGIPNGAALTHFAIERGFRPDLNRGLRRPSPPGLRPGSP